MAKGCRKRTHLTEKQLTVIAHLTEGCSQKRCSQLTGVNAVTISRWLSDNALFQEKLQLEKEKVMGGITEKVMLIGNEALAFFYETLKDPACNWEQKLKAASEIRRILQSSLGTTIDHRLKKADITEVPLADLERIFAVYQMSPEIWVDSEEVN